MQRLAKVLIIVLFVISVLLLLKVVFLPSYPDFRAHYFGGYHILHNQNPYAPDKNYFTSQVYPPSDLLLMSIFTYLPFSVAERVWVIISLAMLFASIWILLRLFRFNNIFVVLLIYTAVFLSFPAKFTLGMGQINMLLLLLLSLFFFFYESNKKVCGILLGIMCAIKFFPLLLFPYLLFKKQWELLVYAVLSLIIIVAVCLLFVSHATNSYFVKNIFPDLVSSWKGDYYNQALSGLIARATNDILIRQVSKIALSVVLVVITFAVLYFKRNVTVKQIVYLELSMLITVNILVNNFSWQHHFVFLIPAYLATVAYLVANKLPLRYMLMLFFSFVLVSVNFKIPGSVPIFLQSHVFYGGLLLWGLLVYLLFRIQPHAKTKK